MREYVFENKKAKKYIDCSGDEMLEIAKAKNEDRCEVFWPLIEKNWSKDNNREIILDAAYRTLKLIPTPNKIEWRQFPKWAKVCVTDGDGETNIMSLSPEDIFWDGEIWDANTFPDGQMYDASGELMDVKIVKITGFPGFRRGTVHPKDSLLIKPTGE